MCPCADRNTRLADLSGVRTGNWEFTIHSADKGPLI